MLFEILTGWLDTRATRDASPMRLYGVRKLSERGGQFWVHTRCYGCGRRACFLASEIEKRLPLHKRLDADIDTLKERFKCSGCGARNPAVWSMADPMEPEP